MRDAPVADSLLHDLDDDVEMGPRSRRTFEREALHGARDFPDEAGATDSMERLILQDKDLGTRKDVAIKKILRSKDSAMLMQRIETLIDSDWVDGANDLPGNIYSIAGMGNLKLQERLFYVKVLDGKTKEEDEWEQRFNPRGWVLERARMMGFLCIMFIQLIGPPAIFLSACMAWGIMSEERIHWERWHPFTEPDFYDWAHISLTKVLATVFIMCFVLNSLFVLMDEHNTWFAMDRTFAYLHQNEEQDEGAFNAALNSFGGSMWISVGAVVNCWVVVWCCLDSFLVIGSSGSPKNVLFDALGLIFLYNLDDTSGDLGFVSAEDWPGAKFAWIYHYVQQGKTQEKPAEGDGTSGRKRNLNQRSLSVRPDDNQDIKELKDIKVSWKSWLVNNMYVATEILLFIMTFLLPLLSALTSFSKLMDRPLDV